MSEPTAPQKRFSFPLWWLIPLLALAGFALFGDKGVLHLWKEYQQRQELQLKVGKLRQENRRLRQEIEKLKNDRQTIESLARRKLGMVRPDELVYQFPPSKQEPKEDAGGVDDRSRGSLTPRSAER